MEEIDRTFNDNFRKTKEAAKLDKDVGVVLGIRENPIQSTRKTNDESMRKTNDGRAMFKPETVATAMRAVKSAENLRDGFEPGE